MLLSSRLVSSLGLVSVVQAEDDWHGGGRDLADLGHHAVHERGRGEVVHQVQEAEAGEVAPVREARGLGPGLDEVVRVQELVKDEAVRLHPLRELVGLAAECDRFVVTLGQEGNLP